MGNISVLAELDAMGWAYTPASENEVKVRCPLHDDQTASCSVNIQEQVFKCHAGQCGASGDFLAFMSAVTKQPRAAVYADLAKRYDLEQVKYIEPSVVEELHQAIWAQKPMLKELYLRGITDDDVRLYRLGFHETTKRVTIPIKNLSGNYVNVRHYMPGAPGDQKMRNSRGRGKLRLYPVEQLKYDTLVLCGGEMKAILTARLLNKHGIGAVTVTGGEGAWDKDLLEWFRGKNVYIMMDIDEAGVKASEKYLVLLSHAAKTLYRVELPLDKDKYPTGDVNNFVAGEGGDLWQVIQSCEAWTRTVGTTIIHDDEEPLEVTFSQTMMSDKVGRKIKFPATVSATKERPFIIPKRILADCRKDQECCPLCPQVWPAQEKLFFISPESPTMLKFVGVDESKLDKAARDALQIPRSCEGVRIEVADHYNAEDVRIDPSLDISNRDTDRTMQQAICVDCTLELNSTYDMVGRMYPHPRTQEATLVISKSTTTHDALTRYEPRRLADLRVFRPVEWTCDSLGERLDEIYTDLEANVTKIFLRRDIHLMVDLAYHSALLIDVDGKTTKGWVEVLVMGDSSQGKSEVTMTLMNHYGLGEKVECKNASVPGLLGGLRQLGTEWYVAWGVIPCNDRKLVVLEEMKGLKRDCFARLTDMRSSGRAEIPKIQKRRTHARTRLIALSNPRDERAMSSFSYGVEAVRDLIGAPEDVRRFDAALIVSNKDVSPQAVSDLVRDPPRVRHRYNGELCRELILWAWTRKKEQVVIPDEVRAQIGEEAVKLCEKYTDEIPLVDRGSMRHKLSRLAVALAARTFSTLDGDELSIHVRSCHVEYVVQMLDRIYSAESFGYFNYSETVRVTSTMIGHAEIQNYLENLENPNEIKNHLLHSDQIEMVDVQDWFGASRDEAQRFISLLVRKRALRRREESRIYFKTTELITWLKALELKERPEHLKHNSAKETM